MSEEVIAFRLDPQRSFDLTWKPGVFAPTETTRTLISAIERSSATYRSILDLGCGTGIVAICLSAGKTDDLSIYASDLSEVAVECARQNLKKYGRAADVRAGSLFECWKGLRFDLIADDISGISSEIASVSPWFKGVPCESGRDGTALAQKVVREANHYLEPEGRFFFPIISLSNRDKLIEAAKEHFRSVERVLKVNWPLPSELSPHTSLLNELHADGSIDLVQQFGMLLGYTEVWMCKDSLGE